MIRWCYIRCKVTNSIQHACGIRIYNPSKWLTYTVGVFQNLSVRKCSPNQNGLISRTLSHWEISSDLLTIPGPSNQIGWSHRLCPCFFPSIGKAGLETTCMEKPPCDEPSKVDSKNAVAHSNDWSNIFACNRLLAKGATGMVFAGTLKARKTAAALKRILEPEFDQKMANQFFREFKIMKACQQCSDAGRLSWFSAYEVPFLAFIMELLGKTLEQLTQEKDIDNKLLSISFSCVNCLTMAW